MAEALHLPRAAALQDGRWNVMMHAPHQRIVDSLY
jgi:hypothetical protein